jgi:hypothetical protein
MGVGTNVQRRLVALHELDCPWRPCDVEQREGRILRQGNECAEVEIIRYVTEGSFDAYSWQTVLTKAKFIAQVMSGDKGIRSVEDVELATLTYAEVKALASGNPKIIEKAGVDAEIAKYASLLSVWRNQRYANESEVASLPMRIESNERLLAALVADAERAHAVLGTDLVVNVHGRTYRGREEIGEVLQGDRAQREGIDLAVRAGRGHRHRRGLRTVRVHRTRRGRGASVRAGRELTRMQTVPDRTGTPRRHWSRRSARSRRTAMTALSGSRGCARNSKALRLNCSGRSSTRIAWPR